MKTFNVIALTLLAGALSFSLNSQTVVYGGNLNHQPKNHGAQPGEPSKKMGYGNNGWNPGPGPGPGVGGNITFSFGSPGYGYPGYNNYYGNGYYSMRKAARYAINRSASMLSNATWYEGWDNFYSPLLAKAIRHQQYAHQLYRWGDYTGAYNHAERASYLAWHVMSYYNDPYAYNNGYYGHAPANNYPDPYSDPYNPYYKQSNPNTVNDPPYQPSVPDGAYKQKPNGDSGMPQGKVASKPDIQTSDLDSQLPNMKADDKELLHSFKAHDMMIE